MPPLSQTLVLILLFWLLTACGGGSSRSVNPPSSLTGSSSSLSASSVSSSSSSSSSSLENRVRLNLELSFDSVPHKASNVGLDYANTQAKPARGITIEIRDDGDELLGTTQTDADGKASVLVDAGQVVKVRALAKLESTNPFSWEVSVRDNTDLNRLYAIEGQLNVVDAAGETRRLHASSGWNGSFYSATRSAGPFAILDSIYTGLHRLQLAGLNQNLSPLTIFWSEKNTTAEGDVTLGEIGTSYFSSNQIYLLGDADVDTDEYDKHVILHEWTHFLERALSRFDNIGGDHSQLEKMDMRLAFSEGFANAWSGILMDDVIYKDALGASQSTGFFINLADKSQSLRGWYSEGSVGAIVYNYYLTAINGPEANLIELLNSFTSTEYKSSSYLSSIFLFSSIMQAQSSAGFATWVDLLKEQNINSISASGEGEVNAGGYAEVLPVYKKLSLVTPSVSLCSTNRFGNQNHLGNFQFVHLAIQNPRRFTIQANAINQNIQSDPDIYLYSAGINIYSARSAQENTESFSLFLQPGEYSLAVVEADLLDASESRDITHCFQLELSED